MFGLRWSIGRIYGFQISTVTKISTGYKLPTSPAGVCLDSGWAKRTFNACVVRQIWWRNELFQLLHIGNESKKSWIIYQHYVVLLVVDVQRTKM